MRPRISIAWGLAAIGFCGVAFAALRSPSYLWASLLFSATLLVLGVAALGATFSCGSRRAFWVGFLAFGSGYLALCYGPWAATVVRPQLATTHLLDYAARRLVRTRQQAVSELLV